MKMLSSIFERMRWRWTGGSRAAIRRPWYLLEFAPQIVEEAKPPMPFVISHSRSIPRSIVLQYDLPKNKGPSAFLRYSAGNPP
jgi:hypothetical protein